MYIHILNHRFSKQQDPPLFNIQAHFQLKQQQQRHQQQHQQPNHHHHHHQQTKTRSNLFHQHDYCWHHLERYQVER